MQALLILILSVQYTSVYFPLRLPLHKNLIVIEYPFMKQLKHFF